MKKKSIAIINYGMGNIGSVAHALQFLNGNYFVTDRQESLIKADAYIVPGVGAFPSAMKKLNELNLIDCLNEQVLAKNKPFLGICLGMQLIALDSVEKGFTKGLGWIEGNVFELPKDCALPVPHVGWNNISIIKKSPLLDRLENNPHFYFDHSFSLQCPEVYVSATCDYGGAIVASIQRDNIFGCQFHPEKSQRNGLIMLRNFLNFVNQK